MARIVQKISGGDFGTNLKNENFLQKFAPAKISPPRPLYPLEERLVRFGHGQIPEGGGSRRP